MTSSNPCKRDEKIVVSIQKKKECVRLAQKAVESLLDVDIQGEFLISQVKFLSQSYYQDVIEERSIIKLCGYAICSNKLGKTPTKQFHISTKTNKVYDITQRKMFCSDACYTASCYLKDQIPSSPVWLLETESFENIHLIRNCKREMPGEEIVLTLKLDEEKPKKNEPVFVNFAIDTLNTLREVGGTYFANLNITEQKPQAEKNVENCERLDVAGGVNTNNQSIDTKTMNVNTEKDGNQLNSETSSIEIKEHEMISHNVEEKLEINLTAEIPEDKGQDCNLEECSHMSQKDTAKHTRKAPQELTNKYNLIEKVNTTVFEWCTPETIKCITIPNYMNDKMKENEPKQEVEVQVEELKVQAYLAGKTSIQPNLEKVKQFLPDIERLEQKFMRQKIVLKKLSEVLPDLLMIFKIEEDITQELHFLVQTFDLQAHNVMLKPAEWNIMGLITIKLLSCMKPSIDELFKSKRNTSRLRKMLLSVNLDYNYVNDLLKKLCVN